MTNYNIIINDNAVLFIIECIDSENKFYLSKNKSVANNDAWTHDIDDAMLFETQEDAESYMERIEAGMDVDMSLTVQRCIRFSC